jgi:hypothetical protein
MKPLLAIALLAASPATADIAITFSEGAPKDRFSFTNEGTCDIGPSTLTLDLGGSAAGLIFDTSASGAGVEVFQPFETVAGGEVIAEVSKVMDGDTQVTMSLRGLPPGATLAFTVDVDDTLTASDLGQIRVSESEISGASVRLRSDQGAIAAVFEGSSRTVLYTTVCTS